MMCEKCMMVTVCVCSSIYWRGSYVLIFGYWTKYAPFFFSLYPRNYIPSYIGMVVLVYYVTYPTKFAGVFFSPATGALITERIAIIADCVSAAGLANSAQRGGY